MKTQDLSNQGIKALLSPLRIVLVATTHPGNIGAAARAMKTMGLQQLVLVQPKQFPCAEATARASGADDILARATVVEDLDAALVDCRLVIGASARLRRLSWPQLDTRESAQRSIEFAAGGQTVALVFGREHAGLTNEELERCHYLLNIPSDADFSSLNLGAAVQVISYELRMAALQYHQSVAMQQGQDPGDNNAEYDFGEIATADQLSGFYDHLQQVLIELEFLDAQHPRKMMRRLKRLYSRAQLSQTEVNILRGILSLVQKRELARSDRSDKSGPGGEASANVCHE